MSGKCFLDTNVLVYSCDSSDVAKQQAALGLISALASRGEGVISTQVLGEFFHATVIRRKLLKQDQRSAGSCDRHRSLYC
jgi:predicted nucleic acid-binding protein